MGFFFLNLKAVHEDDGEGSSAEHLSDEDSGDEYGRKKKKG